MPAPFRPRSTLAALAIASLLPAAALAQTTPAAAAAPESEFTFTGNLGLYSQYVFRGISQTNEKPAVQGGFDLGHKSGFYVGTWASNQSWITDGYPVARCGKRAHAGLSDAACSPGHQAGGRFVRHRGSLLQAPEYPT